MLRLRYISKRTNAKAWKSRKDGDDDEEDKVIEAEPEMWCPYRDVSVEGLAMPLITYKYNEEKYFFMKLFVKAQDQNGFCFFSLRSDNS